MKLLMKRSCKCGRKIMVERPKFGLPPKPVCGYCKTYGLEKSIELMKEFEDQFKVKKLNKQEVNKK